MKSWHPTAIRKASPNYTKGRSANVQAIVLHIAQGSASSALGWLVSPKSEVSCGFFITKAGLLYQLVSINDTSWTNGLIWKDGRWLTPHQKPVSPSWRGLIPGKNPNGYTISIEHEGDSGDPITAAMQRTQTDLLKWLCEQLRWPQLVPGMNLIGHGEINPVDKPFCPGKAFDFGVIAQRVNQQLNPQPSSLARYRAKAIMSKDPSDNFAAVRIAPSRDAAMAMIGPNPVRLQPGFEIEVDAEYNGWLHIAKPDQWGWSAASLFERIA